MVETGRTKVTTTVTRTDRNPGYDPSRQRLEPGTKTEVRVPRTRTTRTEGVESGGIRSKEGGGDTGVGPVYP